MSAFSSESIYKPHQDGFVPTALEHDEWVSMYCQDEWEFVYPPTNEELLDEHPDTNIKHTHTITRILARKK